MSVWHVATTGNDGNGGTSLFDAKLTVSAGVALAFAGDTVYIHAGTYTGTLNGLHPSINTIRGGTSFANAITIAAFPGDTVILQPSDALGEVIGLTTGTQQYLIFDGLILDGTGLANNGSWGIGLYIENAHHIRFQNGIIRNTPGQGVHPVGSFNELLFSRVHTCGLHIDQSHGVYIRGSDNLIEDCEIDDNAAYGVTIFDSTMEPSRNIGRRLRIHNNCRLGGSGPGFGIAGGDDNRVINCQFWDGNGRMAVEIAFQTPTNTKIYNNSCYQADGIEIGADSTGADVRNNITWFTSGTHTVSDAGSGSTVANNLDTDPSFVNAATEDFHLQSGSAARDAGATIAVVPTDYDLLARPQGPAYCIGAFEFPVGSSEDATAKFGWSPRVAGGSSGTPAFTATPSGSAPGR